MQKLCGNSDIVPIDCGNILHKQVFLTFKPLLIKWEFETEYYKVRALKKTFKSIRKCQKLLSIRIIKI